MNTSKIPTTTVVEVFSVETPWEVVRSEVTESKKWLAMANYLRPKFSSDYSIRVNEVSEIGEIVRSTVLF